jgi:hypothetical protein
MESLTKGTAAVGVYKWILADNAAEITETTKVTDVPIEEAGREKQAKVVGAVRDMRYSIHS